MWGITLLALVVLAVSVGVVVQHLGGSPGKPVQTGIEPKGHSDTSPPMPTQMVVWAQTAPGDLSIQVVASRSGRVIRTLATDDGLFDGFPQPSVSPSGTVYYDNSVGGSAPPNPGPLPVERIMSIPLSGGAATFVAYGHYPQVSPNGRYLAYLTYTQITNAPEGIVVKDLVTGAEHTWQYSARSELASGPYINTISWSPDSKSLVVAAETYVSKTPHQLLGRLSLSEPTSVPLDDLPQVPLPRCPPPTPWAPPDSDRGMAWAGFLNSKDGIGICHHVGLTRQDDWTRPVIVDLATGHVVRKLPVVPGLIAEGPGGGGGYQIDPSGHHLLFIGKGAGAGGLYRWTLGSQATGTPHKPVLVKSAVGSASWVPQADRVRPEPRRPAREGHRHDRRSAVRTSTAHGASP